MEETKKEMDLVITDEKILKKLLSEDWDETDKKRNEQLLDLFYEDLLQSGLKKRRQIT